MVEGHRAGDVGQGDNMQVCDRCGHETNVTKMSYAVRQAGVTLAYLQGKGGDTEACVRIERKMKEEGFKFYS